LRGSLHYSDAIRGTIITTSNFTKECSKYAFYRGAPPITLIDGEGLLDLLMKYKIGVLRHQKDVFEIDENYFKTKVDESLKI
jgi:restriction system protein